MSVAILQDDLRCAMDPVAFVRRLGRTPDPWQAEALRDESPKALYTIPRQAGKSRTAADKIAHRAHYGADGYTALLSGPSERQSTELLRKVAEVLRAVEPEAITGDGATHLTLTRDRRVLAVPAVERTVRTFTADDLVLDEAARIPDAFYLSVRPMLTIKAGRLLALSTPWGKRGWFYQEWTAGGDEFRRFHRTWRDCPRMDAAFIEAERRAAARNGLDPDSWIAQEYEGSFEAAVQGAYYAAVLRTAAQAGRITDVPIDPRLPVETWWDIGYGDATAIWFVQRGPFALRIVDYYESSGVGLEHYRGVLRERAAAGAYTYSRHVMPHDADAGDPASGKTYRRSAEDLGVTPVEIAPKLGVDAGIQAVRALFPRCWIDRTRCKAGLEALGFYHREYDDERQTFKPKPEHDWSSHAADAFRYGAVADRGALADRPPDAPVSVIGFNPMRIGREATVGGPAPVQVIVGGFRP